VRERIASRMRKEEGVREKERERGRVRGDRRRGGGEQRVEKAVPIEQAADERQSECSN